MSWTYGLAELAGNATLLARRIASQSVLASETRTQRALLERVVDGGRLGEELAKSSEHASHELSHEHLVHGFVGQSGTDIILGQ